MPDKQKPMLRKCYGSIPHLMSSKFGRDDRGVNAGEERFFVRKSNPGERIIVTEKMDGSCVGVLKKDEEIIPINRAGYRASDSPWDHHKTFAKWAMKNVGVFDALLDNGTWVVGEWCDMAHGTIYKFQRDRAPFFVFDIMDPGIKNGRVLYKELQRRIWQSGLTMVPVLFDSREACSIHQAMKLLGIHGTYNADLSEGAVWRREDDVKCIALAKYVRHEKIVGKYLPSESGKYPIWLWEDHCDTTRE